MEGKKIKPLEVRISEAILEYRKKHNISQKELADKCGISTRTLSDIELGKTDYMMGTVGIISKVIGVKFVFVPNEDLE